MMSLFYTGSFQTVTLNLVSHHLVLSLVQLHIRLHQICLKKGDYSTVSSLKTHLKSHTLGVLLQTRRLLSAENALGLEATLAQLNGFQLETKRLARLMHALHPQQPKVELTHVLNSLMPLSFLAHKDSRVIVMDSPTAAIDWPLDSVLVERLPSVFHALPTQWVVATRSYLHTWAEQLYPALQASNPSLSPEWLTAVTAHVLGVRLLGTAYYAEFVVSELVRRDFTTLVKIEPILFEALNFFGTGTSQAVRLHGITEALSEELKLNAKRNEESEVVDVPALLRVLEKHVLAEDSFNEKHVGYALRLLERLKAGLPVSSLQHHDLNEVWDKLHALGLTEESTETPDYKALHEQNAIYQLMEQVGETPVGVREMLLAAWMHRLEEASDVLSYFSDVDEADLWQAWEAFYRSEEAIQQRFIKSIETAEVHQVLMGQSRRHFRVKTPSANGQASLAQKQSVASKQPSFV
ncbi:MAG: hypothetical protein ACK551_07395 [Vampirovibrionales bacterium]